MIEQILPEEAAALLMAWLERHGARVWLAEGDYVRCNLDGCDRVRGEEDAARIATAIFALRDQIREILRAERSVH